MVNHANPGYTIQSFLVSNETYCINHVGPLPVEHFFWFNCQPRLYCKPFDPAKQQSVGIQ